MSNSLGYKIIDKTPLTTIVTQCTESVGGDSGTQWNLKGYLFMNCTLFKEEQMAYNLFLKNGSETGATVVDKLNIIVADLNAADLAGIPSKFIQISNDINTLSANLTNLELDVNELDTELDTKVDKQSVGVLAGATTVVTTQGLLTTYQKLGWIDSIYVDEANGHISYDNLNKRLTFNTAGIYQIHTQANIAAGNGREVTFKWYRNGVEFETTLPAVYITQGDTKPISVSDTRVFVAQAGDYLEVYGRADSATNLQIKASNISVIKQCCSTG